MLRALKITEALNGLRELIYSDFSAIFKDFLEYFDRYWLRQRGPKKICRLWAIRMHE